MRTRVLDGIEVTTASHLRQTPLMPRSKCLCIIAGERPQLITIDEQAKTVDKFPDLTVFKVSDKAVWLLGNKPPELSAPPDVKFTVIARSTGTAGALITIDINEDATVQDNAYPFGDCWEQKSGPGTWCRHTRKTRSPSKETRISWPYGLAAYWMAAKYIGPTQR